MPFVNSSLFWFIACCRSMRLFVVEQPEKLACIIRPPCGQGSIWWVGPMGLGGKDGKGPTVGVVCSRSFIYQGVTDRDFGWVWAGPPWVSGNAPRVSLGWPKAGPQFFQRFRPILRGFWVKRCCVGWDGSAPWGEGVGCLWSSLHNKWFLFSQVSDWRGWIVWVQDHIPPQITCALQS